MSDRPIADYALLSDCHSAALVNRMGSVDWLCLPRFDSPSIFGCLLDSRAGHWYIRPENECSVSRKYVQQTLVLETTFNTPTGNAVLRDAMAIGRNERGHMLGAGSPHALLRSIHCTHGKVDLETEFAPRAEYGLVHPLLVEVNDGISARGGATVLLLSSALHLGIDRGTA